MSKVIKTISNIVLVILIILLVSYIALRITNKIRIYKVETGSMEDKIHAGDYILLYRRNNYHVGDVVTYHVDTYFVTHRIIKIEDNKITTKGDANNLVDEEISIDQIEGKVIYCGGILNIIINYKFVIVSILVGLYLISWYIEREKK
jgi:signal peptidase